MLCVFLLVYCLSSTTCSELLSRYKRSWIIDSFTIEEGFSGPFPYALGKINIEREYLVYFDIYGEGVDKEPKGVISINQDGTLFVHKPVDYEMKTMLKLVFEVRKPDFLIDTKLGVEIYIQDINDNPPRFHRDLYEISIGEENTQGSLLLRVMAYDRDQRGTPNSTFHYEIKHVSPNIADTEFFIDESGAISFKGCLDHEVAEMFTLLVEAKDHGEVVSLSSSTTVAIHVQDGNDHLPTFTGQTGTGKVKEGEIGSSPLRLHVADEDTPKSPAWRARYTIQGDKGGHFEIKTDPDTNDGILTVVKPLDFEEGAQRELSISVENEVPYFSCKVKERTSSGLWTVDTSTSDDSHTGQGPSVKIIVEVEDVNDPPVFAVTVKEAVLKENSPIGTWVEKVTAVDPDSSHARDFLYKVAHDPSGWVTVDPNTGDITTVKSPDRESPHVVNGVYSILLYAVDKGEPPLTGTSTLQIHVTDLNDNLPQMTTDYLDVCMSSSVTNITAFDLDENPFGGPFKFELLGDVKGKWKLNPSYGYTAGLVKQPGVYAGPYTINVKISDLQGEFGVYNLSVTVCNCSVTPTCRTQRKTATKAASGAIGIVFASLLLLLFLLLTSVVISRNKKEFIIGQISEASGETLLASNIETPGTDCKMPDCFLKPPAASPEKYQDSSKWQTLNAVRQTFPTKYQQDMKNTAYENYGDYRRDVFYGFNDNWNQENMLSLEQEDMSTMNYLYKREASHVTDATVLALLHWRLSSLQETEDDLDYQPHPYAEEGNFDDHFELENITIPDDDESFQKVLRDLGSKFNQMALICKPVDGEN